MLAALAPSTFATDHDLEDARQSLAYWEARAHTLPRHAVRRRREAREMAARWSARVSEAEQMAYGRGLLGALLLLVAEQRLPQAARHRGRLLARRVAQALLAVCVCLIALAVAGMWALVELLAAVLRAVA